MMQIIVFALFIVSLFGIIFQLHCNHKVSSYLRAGLTDFMGYCAFVCREK